MRLWRRIWRSGCADAAIDIHVLGVAAGTRLGFAAADPFNNVSANGARLLPRCAMRMHRNCTKPDAYRDQANPEREDGNQTTTARCERHEDAENSTPLPSDCTASAFDPRVRNLTAMMQHAPNGKTSDGGDDAMP